LVLTENVPWQLGQVWLKKEVDVPFTASFRYKAGGGAGSLGQGDGFVFMFFKDSNYTPQAGGYLGFDSTGYGIEFDSYGYNQGDPSESHVALIKDSATNHLSHVYSPKTKDYEWHSVKIEVSESTVKVTLDGQQILAWSGNLSKRYSRIGFSGSTGEANNWHIIDDVEILLGQSVQPSINSAEENKVPGQISVFVNGVLQTYSTPPIIVNGRVMVPMRGIFESLGATVDWDDQTKTVTAYKTGILVSFKVGDSVATVNGVQKQLSPPALIINGRTMVPLRFVSESLGATVNWDSQTKTVSVFSERVVSDSLSTN
jgi:hypothetical protein